MKKVPLLSLIVALILTGFTRLAEKPANSDVIFAVLDDGTIIEPFAKIKDGKLLPAISGSEDEDQIKQFNETYYKPGTTYSLIYGGKRGGTVTVKKSNTGTDCGGATAQASYTSAKVKLKGFELALATNYVPAKQASGVRRAATPAEKASIDKLVIADYKKNNSSVKGMKTVKLTVIDAGNNKKNEIVGTYIVSPSGGERGLFFFIAVRNTSGVYSLNYSSYQKVTNEDVMSGEVTDVDSGVYQEMLLDVLDINNDGVSEIFTVSQSFEGVTFYSYQWDGRQWTRILDAGNYHCAY